MNDLTEALKAFPTDRKLHPQIGLILGSGLGDIAEQIEDPLFIPYKNIPHFPESTVEGHKGRFIIGTLEGKSVIAMQGRYHYYEGYSLKQVSFPVRVMNGLGIDKLLVTNACGGINKAFHPGDLMLINDHINMLGSSPLMGVNDPQEGPRFPDMSTVYDRELIQLAKNEADVLHLPVQEGVYLATPGPQYETPAEIRMMRVLGADAVGMSTVPEVIAAAHLGLRVLGISCITNMACGIVEQKLSHHDVIETANRVKTDFSRFVRRIIAAI
ncbi:MAG: purine-nucleoside phosphorylase [Sporolactobacillus sp.]